MPEILSFFFFTNFFNFSLSREKVEKVAEKRPEDVLIRSSIGVERRKNKSSAVIRTLKVSQNLK